MSPDGTISAEHVWKRFRADRMRRQLRAHVATWRRSLPGRRQYRWALRDVGLSARPGESVGLIGRNGSGKSTLLKLLSRVMYPYAGSIEVTGRVGALIEVRAGIHPELSGRENIELYGTLLGFTRADVRARFDDIVEFAELGEAVDRQVKFFSSGMQMRLGFSVAAFLEPDVLLVDEVLAVGDAAFQHKCLDRMRQVLERGTTLVFVSHDLAAVEALCERSVWLDQGVVRAEGDTPRILEAYRASIEASSEEASSRSEGPVQVRSVRLEGSDGPSARSGGPLTITVELEATRGSRPVIVVGITDGTANPAVAVTTEAALPAGRSTIVCDIEHLPLHAGRYFVWLAVQQRRTIAVAWQPVASFDVLGPYVERLPPGIVRVAPIWAPARWDVREVSEAAPLGRPTTS